MKRPLLLFALILALASFSVVIAPSEILLQFPVGLPEGTLELMPN